MSIAHANLVTRVMQLLAAMPELADGGVHRMRSRKVPESVSRLIVVRKERADPQQAEIEGGPLDWTTQIVVECYARGVDGVPADLVADDLFEACLARLRADPTLGGTAMDLLAPRMAWDVEDDAANPAAATVGVFPVMHRTDSFLQELT